MEIPDYELPGMWEMADFMGGRTDMIHSIDIRAIRKIGPITWYQAVCACGSRSPMHGTTAHVERWGQRHIEFYGGQDD